MDPNAYREMAETEDRHWWFVGRRAILADLVGRLKLPRDAAILEIGAGTGGNLAWLGRYGTVTAVELDPFAREHASRRSGIEVLAGALPDAIPVGDRSFDLVCMFDVLEHVKADEAAARTVARLLKPGGRFVVTVPAYEWMWSQHDVMLHHFRRYSRASLRAAIERAGLTIDRLTSFNAALFPLAAAARLTAKIGGGGSPGAGMPSRPVNALLARILSAERLAVRFSALPFGLSLLAVAVSRSP